MELHSYPSFWVIAKPKYLNWKYIIFLYHYYLSTRPENIGINSNPKKRNVIIWEALIGLQKLLDGFLYLNYMQGQVGKW